MLNCLFLDYLGFLAWHFSSHIVSWNAGGFIALFVLHLSLSRSWLGILNHILTIRNMKVVGSHIRHIHVIAGNYFNEDLEFTFTAEVVSCDAGSGSQFAGVGGIGSGDVLSAGLGFLLRFCAERRIVGSTWEDARDRRSSRLVRPRWCG